MSCVDAEAASYESVVQFLGQLFTVISIDAANVYSTRKGIESWHVSRNSPTFYLLLFAARESVQESLGFSHAKNYVAT